MTIFMSRRIQPLRYLSLCSGIEAATVAWKPLGWTPVAFAEIDKFPATLLTHHYPDVPNLGDMRGINGADYLDKIDVLVGGTPCQSFSIAGLRGGLDDKRGNLALEFVRIANESNPTFIIWENVPGVFSDRGNAFGCFLAALAGEDAPLLPPGGRWTNVGYVLGPQRAIAWVVKDAQYFGVAQRRKRVFVVACPRDGADPRKILFEFDGLRRDFAPRRETRTDVAGTIESSIGKSRGAGTSPAALTVDRNYVPDIVWHGMTCKWSKGTSGPAGDEHHNLVVTPINTQISLRHKALGKRTGLGIGAPGDPSFTLQRGHSHAVHVAHVAPPLTHKVYGDNASREDALIPIVFDTTQITSPQNHSNPLPGQPCHSLSSMSHAPAIAFHGSQDPYVSGEVTHPLGTNQGQEACLFQYSAVRRLTPRECERLQGFPDDYTLIPYRGKSAADGPRYKALGNSMPVPVMRWIGERIERYMRNNPPVTITEQAI